MIDKQQKHQKKRRKQRIIYQVLLWPWYSTDVIQRRKSTDGGNFWCFLKGDAPTTTGDLFEIIHPPIGYFCFVFGWKYSWHQPSHTQTTTTTTNTSTTTNQIFLYVELLPFLPLLLCKSDMNHFKSTITVVFFPFLS